ncbi:MAG: anti-sigma factor [Acidimicrobiales bacterium]
MTALFGHEEIEALLGAFALDAVDGEERQAVEDHVRECPRCRAEVEQHREVAARLAFAGFTAPEGLWGRIAAELEPAEPEPDLARLYPFRPARTPRPWLTQTVLSAAAAIALVVGVLGWQVHRQSARVNNVASQLVRVGGLNQAVRDATLDPKASKFSLTSVDGRVHIDAVMEPDGTGYLIPHGSLAGLTGDQTYQLWGVVGGQRISLGLLGAHPDVVAFRASGAKLTALAVTAEAAGGVLQSDHAPVAAGFVA